MSTIQFPAEFLSTGPSCDYSNLSPTFDELIRRKNKLSSVNYSESIQTFVFYFRIGEIFEPCINEVEYDEIAKKLLVEILFNETSFYNVSKDEVFNTNIYMAAEKMAVFGQNIDHSFLGDQFLNDIRSLLQFPISFVKNN